MNRAAGAPSITAWSKLRVSGSIGLATTCPSRTTARSATPPTVTISVSGASGMAQPQPWENIPIEVTPTAGPKVAATSGLLPADSDGGAPQRPGQAEDLPGQAAKTVRLPGSVLGRGAGCR